MTYTKILLLGIEERNGKYRKYLANEDTIIVRMMPGLPFSITENMSNGKPLQK